MHEGRIDLERLLDADAHGFISLLQKLGLEVGCWSPPGVRAVWVVVTGEQIADYHRVTEILHRTGLFHRRRYTHLWKRLARRLR